MTYGYCVYHEIECDYKGNCIDCPHNTEEDVEWFKQDEERAEIEDIDGITEIGAQILDEVSGIIDRKIKEIKHD